MENLIQKGERKFRKNLSDEDLGQMMPILLPGVDPEHLCYREVAFRIMLQQELLRSIRYCTYTALVLIKLNNEEISPTGFGEVVSIVRRSIRTTDLVGQFSGKGTLGIVLLNAPSGPTELVVTRIREEISMFLGDPGFAEDPSNVVSVVCPAEANSWEVLLRVAVEKLQ
ncbi:MAG: hypothetical protein ABIJ42_06420 [Acidobacteriota bacterium]